MRHNQCNRGNDARTSSMSYRDGHQPLTAPAYGWLAAGADPIVRRILPGGPLSREELAILIEAATAHGVLPALGRSLRFLRAEFGPSAICSDRNAAACVSNSLRDLDQHRIMLAGQSLLLAHYGRTIAEASACEALPARVVKGPVFSTRLYPEPSDRNFTDIDILIDPAALPAGRVILGRLGLVPALVENSGRRDPVEFKWLVPGNPTVLVEVQTNLIHSRNLGSGISLSYSDLLAAGADNPEDATALLLVAAVHGAAGHQFERLQPVVDVLQAARAAAGPIDRERLADVCAATGATFAVQSALDLAARLFNEPAARELADTLSTRLWRKVHGLLISPAMVLRAQARDAGRDLWRRQTFRDIIRRRGKATMLREAWRQRRCVHIHCGYRNNYYTGFVSRGVCNGRGTHLACNVYGICWVACN